MAGFESPNRAQAIRTFDAPCNEVVRFTTGGRRRSTYEPETRVPRKTHRRGFVPPPASPTKHILKYAGLGKQEDFSVGCYRDGTDVGTKVSKGAGGIGIIVDPKMTVVEVERGSAAHDAGLKRGMKLTAVDGIEVKSQAEAVAALRRAGDEVYIKCDDKAAGKDTGKAIVPKRGNIGGRLSCFFNDEPTPSRPAASAGLPGCGPTNHWADETPRSEPPSIRSKKDYQHTDKPNLMSPRLSAVSPRLGTQHKNSTSYQVAAAAGEEERFGKGSPRRKGQVDVSKGAGNIVEHTAPANPAERTAVFLAHSPARGRAKQGGWSSAWGAVPGMRGDVPTHKSKKPIEIEHSLYLGSASPKVGARPDERRSRTPDRPLTSWTHHGDITGGFRNIPGDTWQSGAAPEERRTTGVRMRTYHHEQPDFVVDRQQRRSFTPNARHSRPMPEPTDVLSHGHCTAYSPRSGRRPDNSPHRTHNSGGVWGCLRTE